MRTTRGLSAVAAMPSTSRPCSSRPAVTTPCPPRRRVGSLGCKGGRRPQQGVRLHSLKGSVRRVAERLLARSERLTIESESSSSQDHAPLEKDLKRYESLFRKYSSASSSQTSSTEVLTLSGFQQMMHDAERKENRYWDEVFVEEYGGLKLREVPGKVASVLYDRIVAGKARRGSSKFIFLSSLGIFLGFVLLCSVCAYMTGSSYFAKFHDLGAPFILGSFGTFSILLFGQATSANVRVWNVVMGHLIGATCGFLTMKCLGYTVMAKAVAMASTMALMLWTGAVHPPGGAIALLMVQDTRLQIFQHWYILYPALFGALVLYFVGYLTNISKKRFNAR